jgi:hypothetical protein
MSSFQRTIQRTVNRAKDPDCRAPHYMGRGSKLGVVNERDPCRTGKRKAPKPWRAKIHAEPRPRFKLSPPSPRPAKAEVVAAHKRKQLARREARRAVA